MGQISIVSSPRLGWGSARNVSHLLPTELPAAQPPQLRAGGSAGISHAPPSPRGEVSQVTRGVPGERFASHKDNPTSQTR